MERQGAASRDDSGRTVVLRHRVDRGFDETLSLVHGGRIVVLDPEIIAATADGSVATRHGLWRAQR